MHVLMCTHVDAEIKVPFAENPELSKVLSFSIALHASPTASNSASTVQGT